MHIFLLHKDKSGKLGCYKYHFWQQVHTRKNTHREVVNQNLGFEERQINGDKVVLDCVGTIDNWDFWQNVQCRSRPRNPILTPRKSTVYTWILDTNVTCASSLLLLWLITTCPVGEQVIATRSGTSVTCKIANRTDRTRILLTSVVSSDVTWIWTFSQIAWSFDSLWNGIHIRSSENSRNTWKCKGNFFAFLPREASKLFTEMSRKYFHTQVCFRQITLRCFV